MERQSGGRTREANANDKTIRAAAREVFTTNPDAPIADVAKLAGVGIGALYRRYESKELLLASLCEEGQRIYIETAETALASEASPWEAYVAFLREIVARDTHALSSSLAGTFPPTEVHQNLGMRLNELADRLFDRVKLSGALRPDVTQLDIGFMLEALAQVKLGDAARSAELRQRLLTLIIDALRAGEVTPLPGTPPTWQEQDARWIPKNG